MTCIAPTPATVKLARRIVEDTPDHGADAVLKHLPDLFDGQAAALIGVLAKMAAQHPVEAPPETVVYSIDPAQVCHVIAERTAARYGLRLDLMLDQRTTHHVTGRQVAMTAAWLWGVTYSEVGRQFDRDHATVMYAVRKVHRSPDLLAAATDLAACVRIPESEAS